MKKFILLLITIILPLGVNALAVSETFDVGDSVSVELYDGYESENPNGIGFHVLRASGAGERTVTLIYDGVLLGNNDDLLGSPMIYDEAIPSNNEAEAHDLTVILEQSAIGKVLKQHANKEGAKWNTESERLLSLSDINYLQISTKNALGFYEIPAKYSFLAPIKAVPSANMYNYWTTITDDPNGTTVYYVKYNENRASLDDVLATIEPVNLAEGGITDGYKYGLRPVVEIDKKYILCNNTKNPTTPTTAPDSPKTGVEDYILPLGIVAIVASVVVIATKKKNVFNQI